jgi:hypothetical protein
LEGVAKAISNVVQMSWEVLQSTTKCKTSTEREDKRALMIKWSCCFHDKYTGLTEGEDVAADARWERGMMLESFKEITCCVFGRGMMAAATVDAP